MGKLQWYYVRGDLVRPYSFSSDRSRDEARTVLAWSEGDAIASVKVNLWERFHLTYDKKRRRGPYILVDPRAVPTQEPPWVKEKRQAKPQARKGRSVDGWLPFMSE